MTRRIVMLGAPASGKGTQAARLASHFELPNLSTGALIRAEQSRDSDLGKLANQFLVGGGFLPDDLILEIMAGWLAEDGAAGFVLDGFPRTLPQARAFDGMLASSSLQLDAVVLLESDPACLARRAEMRIQCNSCGGTFRAGERGLAQGAGCPEATCSGELKRRPDDDPETFLKRLEKYQNLTAPLVDHYQRGGTLRRIDASGSPEAVFQEIVSQLSGLAASSPAT